MFKLIKEGCKFGAFAYIAKVVYDLLWHIDHRLAKKLENYLIKEKGSQE